MSSKYVIETNDSNFDDIVLKSNVPVIVDFWAPWCGPCVAIAPIFEQMAMDIMNIKDDLVKFVKVNVDDSPKTADRYNIRSIPTIALFENGDLMERGSGADEGLDVIKNFLEGH